MGHRVGYARAIVSSINVLLAAGAAAASAVVLALVRLPVRQGILVQTAGIGAAALGQRDRLLLAVQKGQGSGGCGGEGDLRLSLGLERAGAPARDSATGGNAQPGATSLSRRLGAPRRCESLEGNSNINKEGTDFYIFLLLPVQP